MIKSEGGFILLDFFGHERAVAIHADDHRHLATAFDIYISKIFRDHHRNGDCARRVAGLKTDQTSAVCRPTQRFLHLAFDAIDIAPQAIPVVAIGC